MSEWKREFTYEELVEVLFSPAGTLEHALEHGHALEDNKIKTPSEILIEQEQELEIRKIRIEAAKDGWKNVAKRYNISIYTEELVDMGFCPTILEPYPGGMLTVFGFKRKILIEASKGTIHKPCG